MARAAAVERLLEREAELRQLEGLLERARAGEGRLLVIEGPPGIGKTRLLEEAQHRATEKGMAVLRARAGELERDFPFGVVGQLFEPRLAGASDAERQALLSGAARLAAGVVGEGSPGDASGAPAASFPTLHGLFWLCANLADEKPLLMTVDDVHWSDAASLRFLLFLAQRLHELPALLALAARAAEAGTEPQLLAELSSASFAQTLHLRSLSAGAVEELVREALAGDADSEFCEACHQATGGNPFLLEALVSELAAETIPPRGEEAARVRRLGPRSIARAVLLRLARVPENALALARAAAVLGEGSELRHAAALAGLAEDEAAVAADALAAADILRASRPLEFVHPIVRSSIYSDIPVSQRAQTHGRAARRLAADGAEPTRVAAHLLVTEPAADGWVVEQLGQVAGNALARGAPDAALAYLRRALAEPPPGELRPEVLLRLGEAEVRTGALVGLDHLREAFELSQDLGTRVAAAGELVQGLLLAGRPEEALPEVIEAIDAIPEADRERGLRLEAVVSMSGYASLAVRRIVTARALRFRPRLAEPLSAGDRLALANVALETVLFDGEAERGAELARRALGNGQLLSDESSDALALYAAINSLLYAEQLEEAARVYGEALADARTRGSLRAFGMSSCWRAAVNYRRGDLLDAVADARAFLDTLDQVGAPIGLPVGLAFLVEALIERGELDSASEALARHDEANAFSDSVLFAFLLHARGRLRICRGETRQGIDDLRACGRLNEAWGLRSPALALWRASAAVAHLRLGEVEEARRLAIEEVEQALAFGAPGMIGVALRAQGLAEGGATGLALLQEAVTAFESSSARLEHARALVDLGAALRRDGQRAAAREPLRLGVDLAQRCGATVLAARAHEELVGSGARPRRPVFSGLQALTPGERRVAQMAAEGMTNSEIAQALFVTVKAVEMHLTNAYRKLEIRSRSQLEQALRVEAATQPA